MESTSAFLYISPFGQLNYCSVSSVHMQYLFLLATRVEALPHLGKPVAE